MTDEGERRSARLYRALHRGRPGDVDFYLRAASGAESALELGAGWGRVLSALDGALPRAVGLERWDALGDMGRAAGLDIRRGDMRDFDLGERFERVFIPYGGAFYLTSPEEVASTLSCARAHLEPGGLLVFDAWSADAFHDEAEPWNEEVFDEVDRVEVDGVRYRVDERTRWRRSEQRLDVTYHFTRLESSRGSEGDEDGAVIASELPQRYLLTEEIPALIEAAGLELLVIHGGFDQHVHDEESEQLIVTARRPT